MIPVRWRRPVRSAAGWATAGVALVSPAGTADMPLSARMFGLLAVAAALGAFVPVATSFATEVGNGTFAYSRLRRYALSGLAARIACNWSLP